MESEVEVREFLIEAQRLGLQVRGAMDHHGHERRSADVALWIKPSAANFKKLLDVLQVLTVIITLQRPLGRAGARPA